MTKYEVWYNTERHTNLITLRYGELTEFKHNCKMNGWKITRITTLKNGLVTKIEEY